jgi:distribution and morphology protein 34
MCRMQCCALCPLYLLQPSCPCPCGLTSLPKSPRREFVNFLVHAEAIFWQDATLTLPGRFSGRFRSVLASPTFRRRLTILQANPLNHKQPDIHLMTGSRGMLAAKEALVVPMLLRLSHFRLCSYVVLVVSKQKGITLVFKTDPLQNVDINSTFDSIAVIQSFIQREIEGLLRQMFREDLPGIIHRLSQQWVKAKVETPYLSKPLSRPAPPQPVTLTMSAPDLRTLPHLPNARQASVAYSMAPGLRPHYPRARTASGPSIAGTTRSRTHRSESPTSAQTPDPPDSTFPEIENFDPTYGLRPEGLPNKSVFRSFGRLFANPSRGLADLAEESTDEDEDVVGSEGASYDMVDWDDTVPGLSPEASVLGDHPAGPSSGLEYETVPAVGGGTVTRPRVFHAHSQVQFRPPRPSSLLSTTSRLTHAALEQLPRGDLPRRPHSLYNSYHFGDADGPPRAPSMRAYSHLRDPSEAPTPPLYHSPPRRPISPSSIHTHESSSHTHTHSVPTPPSTDVLLSTHAPPHRLTRRASITSTSAGLDTDPRIVLRPALHGALSTLATLAHSNHTLSPYTRALSHFTVRSGPRRAPPAPPRAPPRARRRRTHVLGAAAKAQEAEAAARGEVDEHGDSGDEGGGESVEPPSEFDAEDMDRYFRTRDELASVTAISEPGPAYGLQPGLHGRTRVSIRHARPPESLDAYPNSRQRHKYVYRG